MTKAIAVSKTLAIAENLWQQLQGNRTATRSALRYGGSPGTVASGFFDTDFTGFDSRENFVTLFEFKTEEVALPPQINTTSLCLNALKRRTATSNDHQ